MITTTWVVSLAALLPAWADDDAANAPKVDLRRIWDAAPHNAFTGLARFQNRWYCAFREGTGHVSADGALRVIASDDGQTWESVARMERPGEDLRDAKLTLTSDGRLMLVGAVCLDVPSRKHHQSYVWTSENGTDWSDAVPIGELDDWLWRVTWHDGRAYAVGYGGEAARRRLRLYDSDDGRAFRTLVDHLDVGGFPNESTLGFEPDGQALCLVRRDPESKSDPATATAMLGKARAPYTEWTWTDLGRRIGGPDLSRLSDGRWVAGVRLYDGGPVRTSLCWLDPDSGRLTEWVTLPSGGDCSYPGLVEHDGTLWVSYYSSHEGKAAIYLARVPIPAK
jgi:hypothetical protein